MTLRELRETEGLTIKAAAERCGLPPRSWEAWEYGRNTPSMRAAKAILDTFPGKVTLSDLLRTAEQP